MLIMADRRLLRLEKIDLTHVKQQACRGRFFHVAQSSCASLDKDFNLSVSYKNSPSTAHIIHERCLALDSRSGHSLLAIMQNPMIEDADAEELFDKVAQGSSDHGGQGDDKESELGYRFWTTTTAPPTSVTVERESVHIHANC